MIPVFHGRIDEDGKLVFPESVKGLLSVYVARLAGKAVEVTVKVHRAKRTDPQNRYYFGVVVPLIAEHCGYEKDEMHELLAMRFLRIEDDPVTGSPRRQRTPKTDTQEFAEYVDACIRFGAELGVVIPEPGQVAA